jgi:hypothetical protein
MLAFLIVIEALVKSGLSQLQQLLFVIFSADARVDLGERKKTCKTARLCGGNCNPCKYGSSGLLNAPGLPDKDQPPPITAICAGATHLLTGDFRLCGPYCGESVEGFLSSRRGIIYLREPNIREPNSSTRKNTAPPCPVDLLLTPEAASDALGQHGSLPRVGRRESKFYWAAVG